MHNISRFLTTSFKFFSQTKIFRFLCIDYDPGIILKSPNFCNVKILIDKYLQAIITCNCLVNLNFTNLESIRKSQILEEPFGTIL